MMKQEKCKREIRGFLLGGVNDLEKCKYVMIWGTGIETYIYIRSFLVVAVF